MPVKDRKIEVPFTKDSWFETVWLDPVIGISDMDMDGKGRWYFGRYDNGTITYSHSVYASGIWMSEPYEPTEKERGYVEEYFRKNLS